MTDKARNTKEAQTAAGQRRMIKPVRTGPAASLEQVDSLELQQAVEGSAPLPANILALQRSYGNQAVSGVLQAKLKVGAAGDRYEQEADRVAERVLAMPSPAAERSATGRGGMPVERTRHVQAPPQAASLSRLVRRQEEEELQGKVELQRQEAEEEEPLQPKSMVQRQEAEEEEPLQPKSMAQRQDEEEELQTKPLLQRQDEEEELQTKPLLQRQDEEEELQTKPLLQRQDEEEELQTKPLLQRQDEEEELQTKPMVQRQGDGGFEAGPKLQSRLDAQKGGGRPLSGETRAFMEPRFGADFSGVRLHTGTESADLNRQLKARAFTRGKDIYLGADAQTPGSTEGNRLLAHELAHTVQQGASERIAGWWADGHGMITREVGYEQEAFDKSIIDWLASHAGSQDITARSITNFAIWAGFKGKKAVKKYGKQETPLAEKKRMWETGGLMVRMGQERPFHGEASAYQDNVNNSDANKTAVDDQIKKAQTAYKKGFYREGLLQLSDALHTAEDRGSHGEGLAWSGHDPRLALPLRWDGTVNEKYRPGWDCDNVSKNSGGRVLGEKYAKGAYDNFLDGLDQASKLKLAMGIGAHKTDFNWGRDVLSRLYHGFRHTIGGISGLVGEKKLEPAEDKLRDLDEYRKIKEKYPSIGLEQLGQLEQAGERGEESKRGFDRYKQTHLGEVRQSVQKQLLKIVQLINGDMDPFEMEGKYKLFSTLQTTARDYDNTIAGIDQKSDERTLVSQLIEDDANQWKETAKKYSSWKRKVWRFGKSHERDALKEDIKSKAPEHLAFVSSRVTQGR